ncbi:MAG: hypothetical protein ACHQHP_01505, partial [Bacteroidia bacterium]
LCNCLENFKYDSTIESLFQKNSKSISIVFKSKQEVLTTVNEVRNILLSKGEIVKKVVTVRDETFAHLDPNRQNIYITIDEFEELINVCANIYNNLRGKFFDVYMEFNSVYDWSIDPVLKIISEYESKRQKDLSELKKIIERDKMK